MTRTLVKADVGINVVQRANVVGRERVDRRAGRQHVSVLEQDDALTD